MNIPALRSSDRTELTESEIQGALAVMSPEAEKATRNFAAYLLTNPELANSYYAREKAFRAQCITTLCLEGWQVDGADWYRTQQFFDVHGAAVYDTGLAIVNAHERRGERAKKVKKWLGAGAKVAVVALAVSGLNPLPISVS